VKKYLILIAVIFSMSALAGRYDDLEASDLPINDFCAALLRALDDQSGRGSRPSEPKIGAGLDAVMDYFIAGIYLNARWIEAAGLGSNIQGHIIERAHRELDDQKFESMSRNLDNVIAASEPTVETITVWRGQAANVPPPRNGTRYEVGETLIFPQYLSTSNSQELAESYAKGILMKISVPSGTNVLNVQKYLGTPSSQHELLFGRNTTIEIEKVEPRGQQIYIEARMVPSQPQK
jgi:hypothetical protein